MTEAELQGNVIEAAKLLGWTHVYHTHDSRRSEAGFPDLVLLRRDRILVIELKSQTGKLTPEQEGWLYAFGEAGVDWRLFRPEDWLSGAVERALR
jgi:hypothetical protein